MGTGPLFFFSKPIFINNSMDICAEFHLEKSKKSKAANSIIIKYKRDNMLVALCCYGIICHKQIESRLETD